MLLVMLLKHPIHFVFLSPLPRLLFSQSILALDMIEEFLALIDQGELEMPSYDGALPMQFKHWKKERDYLRLDGTVSADIRKSQCKYFNEGNNDRCVYWTIATSSQILAQLYCGF